MAPLSTSGNPASVSGKLLLAAKMAAALAVAVTAVAVSGTAFAEPVSPAPAIRIQS